MLPPQQSHISAPPQKKKRGPPFFFLETETESSFFHSEMNNKNFPFFHGRDGKRGEEGEERGGVRRRGKRLGWKKEMMVVEREPEEL